MNLPSSRTVGRPKVEYVLTSTALDKVYEGVCRGGPRNGETGRFYMECEGFFQCARLIDGVVVGETKMLGWYNFNSDDKEFFWEEIA